MNKIGISKIPYFAIGMTTGAFSKKGVKVRDITIFLVFISLVLMYKMDFPGVIHVREFLIRVVGVFVCVWIFDFLSGEKKLSWLKSVIQWFGKYSLEIYVLQMAFMWLYLDSLPIRKELAVPILWASVIITMIPFNKYTNYLSHRLVKKWL